MSNTVSDAGYVARYLGGGFLNTLVGFSVIFLLMALGVAPLISNISGYAVGIMLGFLVSKKFVFKSDGKALREGWRYLASFLFCFCVNIAVLIASMDVFHLSKEISQLLAAASYTILMYLLSYHLVFVSRK